MKVKSEVTLTVLQIQELAEFAGLKVDKTQSPNDDMEFEITIEDCSKGGITEDDGTQGRYSHIAYFTEYPEEGAFPLGPKLAESNN